MTSIGSRHTTLRQRLMLITVLIVTICSTLFAGVVVVIKQNLEEATFGKMVKGHLHALLEHPQDEHLMQHQLFQEWQFYRGDAVTQLPASIRSLKPGTYHSTKIGDRYYHLQTLTHNREPVFLMYDITEWEKQEHTLLAMLIGGVIVVFVLSILLAGQAANNILEPVVRLTQRLSHIEPGERRLRIASEFSDSDIGRIATAFDAYLARIDEFVERERSLTATASHELRTPLSIMLGAADVIESNNHNPVIERALNRIRRACGEMQAFIEAALFLSREEAQTLTSSNTVTPLSVLQQLLEELQPQWQHLEVDLQCQQSVTLQVPESILKILLGNLLRNAIEHTAGGRITIQCHGDRLILEDTGQGIDEANVEHIFQRGYSTKPGGTGLGLYMVKRICDRYGWALQVQSQVGAGTRIEIHFSR